MKKRIPLTDNEGEVHELTAADLRAFKPATEVLPLNLQKTLGMRARGPKGRQQKYPRPSVCQMT